MTELFPFIPDEVVEPEEKLIRQAQEGAPEAFAEIYERYYDKIYRYILYKITNAYEAEDLANEVFIRVLDKINTYSFTGAPFAVWLFKIASNIVVDYFRGINNHTKLPGDELAHDQSAHDPADVARRHFAREKIAAALGKLSPEQQQVVILKFWAELTNKEIAEILGKTEGAVKALAHRALDALREALQDQSYDMPDY